MFYPAMATLNLAKHLVTRVTFTRRKREVGCRTRCTNIYVCNRSKELASIGECSVGETSRSSLEVR